MQKEQFDITGMTCSACSTRVEKSVAKLPGIKEVSVNLLKNSMVASYDESVLDTAGIVQAVEKAGYGAIPKASAQNKSRTTTPAAKPEVSTAQVEYKQMKQRLLLSALFTIPLFYISMGHMMGWPLPSSLLGMENAISFAFTQFLLLIPVVFINFKYYRMGFKTLFHGSPNMDSLIAIGSSAAIVYGIYAISYDDLSEEDKERYEDDFIEDGQLPDFIPSAALNKFVFNETTVDIVLQDLMDRGIKVAGGDRLGKTILFAQNKRHAEFILERFNKLYPQYRGSFAQRVICDDAYAQTIIDDFKQPEKEPHIAVSVDMMDTGIDVPECVNLVFFKKVRSKSKFWQMIGRGTRLCKGLACVDQIDGTYTDKRRFLIFDYCGNFEYFRQHKEGYETRETKTLSENIFGKQIKIAMALQENTFAGEDYQAWRKEIVNTCHKQVMALNSDLIAVKLRMQYVEKYKKPEAFVSISEGDKGELLTQIAPLVRSDEADEFAKRFDNFMYGLILAHIEQMPAFQYAKKQLCDTASLLERKASIPQIKAKLPMLQEIHTDAFWDANDILLFEQVRKELRELIRFLDEGGGAQRQIVTKLTDPIIDSQEGVQLEAAYDFEDYRAKVNRYVNEHGNTLAIYKLTHNIPLAMGDYQELERVLTSELGSKEDYAREFGDTPFGLLIRKIAKLDHEAAMQAFSAFINDQSLNQKQIAFVNKIINHIELNGYMENVAELTKPPFDKPISFIKLFDAKTRTALMETINQVRENAVQITAS